VIAKYALGHSQPFFAPVAAVIGLNSSLGERGLHAVQLLYGVLVGILVGELALFAVGDAYGTLALATFLAMAIAHALGGARITIAQAAVGEVAEAAVVARPHAELGEVPVACIVVDPGRSLTSEHVTALFEARLAAYEHPRDVVFLDRLPRTSLGKVQKEALRKLVRDPATQSDGDVARDPVGDAGRTGTHWSAGALGVAELLSLAATKTSDGSRPASHPHSRAGYPAPKPLLQLKSSRTPRGRIGRSVAA